MRYIAARLKPSMVGYDMGALTLQLMRDVNQKGITLVSIVPIVSRGETVELIAICETPIDVKSVDSDLGV